MGNWKTNGALAMKDEKKKIKVRHSKLPNLWHQEQVMKGGKVHKSKKNTIPRKQKHKKHEK